MFLKPLPFVVAVTFVAALVASPAWAVNIIKPNPNETLLEQNTPEGCAVAVAGHYAIAAGTPHPFIWSSIPANKIHFDYTPDPYKKHTVRCMAKEGTACSTMFLKVVDTGDLTSNTIAVNPMRFSWPENFVTPSDDRVVGLQKDGDEIRTRTIQFQVMGSGAVAKEVRIRTWKHNLPANGEIDVVAYDGDANAIEEVGPCADIGQAATREWIIKTPVTGGCGTAQTHTLTIKGDKYSFSYEDIEIDLLAWHQGSVKCSDGIGAVILYTVPKIDLESFGLTEAEEENPGEYLYRPAQGTGYTDTVGVAKLVFPDPMPGYSLRIERISPPTPAQVRLDREDQSTFVFDDRPINSGLPFTFWVVPIARSQNPRESIVRAYLVRAGTSIERGGETCRDDIRQTSVEVTITCPTPPPLTTPATATTNGNEWSFNGASPGVMDIYFRATALPNDAIVQSALIQRIEFTFLPNGPIPGSTLTWSSPSTNGGWASYTAASGGLPDRWEARATFTGLPANSTDFGAKGYWMILHRPDAQAMVFSFGDIRYTEVFFGRDETNHPGGQSGSPNWYHYWRQTSAGAISHQMRFDGVGRSTVEFLGAGAGWGVVLRGPAWSHGRSALWGGADGIDHFAWKTLHEEHHCVQGEDWWPVGLDRTDTDGDWIPDFEYGSTTARLEDDDLTSSPVIDPITAGYPYDVNDADTYPDTFGYHVDGGDLTDVEHACMSNQASWTNGAANSQDWAAPGMQHATEGAADD